MNVQIPKKTFCEKINRIYKCQIILKVNDNGNSLMLANNPYLLRFAYKSGFICQIILKLKVNDNNNNGNSLMLANNPYLLRFAYKSGFICHIILNFLAIITFYTMKANTVSFLQRSKT